MTLYTDLIAAVAATESGFSAFVTDDWKQGRTTYGGLSAALCVEAALRTFPEAPPLRSAQFAFVGPASGELAIQVKPLRQGKSTLFVAVDLVGEQGVATHGVLTFGAARASTLSHSEVPAPDVVAPRPANPSFRRAARARRISRPSSRCARRAARDRWPAGTPNTCCGSVTATQRPARCRP